MRLACLLIVRQFWRWNRFVALKVMIALLTHNTGSQPVWSNFLHYQTVEHLVQHTQRHVRDGNREIVIQVKQAIFVGFFLFDFVVQVYRDAVIVFRFLVWPSHATYYDKLEEGNSTSGFILLAEITDVHV